MNKNNKRRDSTTDFFLKVISKEKSKNENKSIHHKNSEERQKGERIINGVITIMNFINTTLDKMLQSTVSVKILSLLLAGVLVFTVSGGVDNIFSSPTSGDYIDSVPIEVEGLDDDFVVAGLPKTASIGLVGSSLDIYTAKLSNNYSLYVDLSGLGEGEQTVTLNARDFPSNLEVFIVPQTVTVTISQKVTKTFDLGYKFINEDKLDAKYSVSVDSIEHESVEVRGSQDNIDKIYEVVALIDLDGVEDSFTQECKIKAFDRSGEELDVQIIPSTVKAYCSVSNYSKTVSLVPEYSGNTAEGYAVDTVEFKKTEVKIYGSETQLKNIDSIKVKIDISDLQADRSFKNLKLIKPTGVNKMSFDTVDGSVKIVPAISRVFEDIDIEVKNGEASNVRFNDTSKVAIQVSGKAEKINALTEENIHASIDIEGLEKGKHEVQVEVELDDKMMQFAFASANKISITIRK